MNTGFDVLDRNLDLKQNILLEASAGTGKTFSIENIVVRLLLCEESLSLDEMLIVTFTRAATRDLRSRIRLNIIKTIESLREKTSSVDFVKAIIENNEIESSIRKLKRALLTYDQSHIYTIHQFCYRMLRDHVLGGNYSLESVSEDSALPKTYLLTIIRDYFRTEISNETYSNSQIKAVLSEYENSIDKLEDAILKTVTKGMEIEEPISYIQQFEKFQKSMRFLKEVYCGKIVDNFITASDNYKELRNIKRQIKPEILERVESFASLFDKDSWNEADFEQIIEDQLFIVKLLDPKKQKKQLEEPEIRKLLKEHLLECVSPQITFARMAAGCRKLLRKHLQEEEKLGFDELLLAANEAIKNPEFSEAVRGKFKGVIIDEFQDTDPIQWEIFNKLFLSANNNWGNIYLVGDPKQSIYAFRQADIYTYIEAGKAIECHATLDTNFRSQPNLIKALNTLFDIPNFMHLPKLDKSLPFHPVKYASEEKAFTDTLGAVHFCMAKEESNFLPFIAQEIQRINELDKLSFKAFSVLVSDRYQAQRVSEYLKKWNIPSMTQRSSSLSDSDALNALRELLKAVLSPNHNSSLKTALGGRLIGWTHDKVRKLDELDLLQEILTRFYILREKLIEEGFHSFYKSFMNLSWGDNLKSVREELLLQDGGDEFYQDLVAIVDILLDEQSRNSLSPIGLLKYLDEFKALDDQEKVKRPLDTSQDAVSIITIHSSKGLEFGVVFTLGLIKTTSAPEFLIPIDRVLCPVLDAENAEYIQYCREIDAEKMRQLYVAMTRAKYRLYCPIIVSEKEKKYDPGTASPMQIFVGMVGLENLKSEYTTVQNINEVVFDIKKVDSELIPVLDAPKSIIIPGSPQYIHSFTSLSKNHSRAINELEPPHDFLSEIKTVFTLPSGSDTGNILHSILENYRFGKEEIITSFIEYTPFREWKDVISTMVKNAFLFKFPEGFTLAEVSEDKCFKETEFLYPYESNYLKGIIDLIFEHNGKYYIIDWKSNWLGPDPSYYTREKLEVAMEENNYFFQAKLYEDALMKYLKIFDKDEFGGTYYLFLRGIDENGNGVYKC